jgi:hypothetical protein
MLPFRFRTFGFSSFSFSLRPDGASSLARRVLEIIQP